MIRHVESGSKRERLYCQRVRNALNTSYGFENGFGTRRADKDILPEDPVQSRGDHQHDQAPENGGAGRLQLNLVADGHL